MLARSMLAVALAGLAVVGCSFELGNSNPRPDDPAAQRPAPPDAAITWSSIEWQPTTFERPPHTSAEQWDMPSAVAAGPGGWVAVGSNNDVTGYAGRIWSSTDSLDWRLRARGQVDELELTGVAATSDAYVAVGTEASNPNAPTTVVLRSADGITWEETTTVPGAWAGHVSAGPSGFAVIVLLDEANDLLLSPDGLTWRRVPGSDIGLGVRIADVEPDGDGWIAAGSAGDRAVLLRSPDGSAWIDEPLPDSGPVDGIINSSAYSVVPGRWATLVLGLDRGLSCEGGDDWCDKYQTAWSWTAETGWTRLPKSTWVLERGFGVDVERAGDAGFLYLLGDDAHTSATGWDWTSVRQSKDQGSIVTDMVVSGDRLVAVGSPPDGPELTGWFGSAVIRR